LTSAGSAKGNRLADPLGCSSSMRPPYEPEGRQLEAVAPPPVEGTEIL